MNLICRSEAQAASSCTCNYCSTHSLFGFVCLTCGCICEWIRGTGLQQEISWPRLKLVHMEGVQETQLSLQEPNIEANLHNSHTHVTGCEGTVYSTVQTDVSHRYGAQQWHYITLKHTKSRVQKVFRPQIKEKRIQMTLNQLYFLYY